MSWHVIWSFEASDDLDGINNKNIVRIIRNRVEAIKDDPYSHVRKVRNSNSYAMRFRSYRIIISLKTRKQEIFVETVLTRSEAYDEFR